MSEPPDEILTEAVLASTHDLDQRSTREVLESIHTEDRRAIAALTPILPECERAVDALVLTLEGGGCWFNVGAGTSGRIGALDAAEIPPTFGYDPARVQAVIAGGPGALLRAVEGAEDDGEAARSALRDRQLVPGDAVVALSASGRTPFALGALEEARVTSARRIAITCDPGSPLARAAEIVLAPEVGPEVIAGSTRMKGGLVQKLLLHMLSTSVMVRLGRVEGNLMTHLNPGSQKLRRRAMRIVMTLGDLAEDEAAKLLDAHGGRVGEAVRALRTAS